MTLHWLLAAIAENRQHALSEAARVLITKELYGAEAGVDLELLQRTAEGLEIAALDGLLSHPVDDATISDLQLASADAFRLYRVLPALEDPIREGIRRLRMSALAVVGDLGSDAARMLRETGWPPLLIDSTDWSRRTWAVIVDVWLRLIRKSGWEDRDAVLSNIASLRASQQEFEQQYLSRKSPSEAKAAAFELIGLYHLAKAAEILAHFITDGVVDGNYQVGHLLETHFDRIFALGHTAALLELEPLSRLLSACATRLVENSIWTVTRAVNSRVTQFVRSLVDRGRGDRAIFDVLPPQRRALAEKGLLGSSRRAVVVSLPTSSGKTLIAQFRILQALNQFEHERGWVAYLAPTRTLVNQIARRLRRDFAPLNVVIEQVSPALEVDSIEMGLLQEQDKSQAFRVLVTTPEKLDLMLRQGCEETIGRPLTLVVVDEAHNLQDSHRGLRLELLLATINKECRQAQFLLLTPFIANAREVAQWLGGAAADDISLALEWQPNDRVIGVIQARKGKHIRGKSYDYRVELETVHTSRRTLTIPEQVSLPKCDAIAGTFQKAAKQSTLAAVAAQGLQARGPVIVMHSRPDWVWSLADQLRIPENKVPMVSQKVCLVQDFLRLEFGEQFPLIDLLLYGIGVHHSGLSDEVRSLIEWLFEEGELRFLVATTTIAQGVNFPVTGVVMASHQYPSAKGTFDMPPEDFWNIAGRAGRVWQGSLGVVALVADDEAKAQKLKSFINRQTGDLNSALLKLVAEAKDLLNDLGRLVYRAPEWSCFLQYLAHTYRQLGQPSSFFDQIEQVLRGTLGFEKLRVQNASLADRLLSGIQGYVEYLERPNQPLKLVDSTGFSLQSINKVLTNRGILNGSSWDSERLFQQGDDTLRNMMGLLLQVPELRENLKAATGGETPDGRKLSAILKDWVNGKSIEVIAQTHFQKSGDSLTKAMTECGRNLFGRLAQTASWGLGALLSITGGDLPEERFKSLSNLPSRVYYGVNSDEAIVLRLLGVPRNAATSLAVVVPELLHCPMPKIREQLRGLSEERWVSALGEPGKTYRAVWRVLEGLENQS